MSLRVLLTTAAALATAAVFAVPAQSAPRAGVVDLSQVEAARPVRDVILAAPPRRAGAARAVARAAFNDAAGLPIRIDSTVPSFDLAQAASVLSSTYHKSEIAKLSVHVTTLVEIARLCGDSQALACYAPADGGNGELWFAADDSDWIHSLVHEYGHHVDNQYANLTVLHPYGMASGCRIDSDGTRDWFFERLTSSNTTDRFDCGGADWEHLLPELFAEDFVVLNGIRGWQLSSAQPPNNRQLKAMKYDIDTPLLNARARFTRRIRRGRAAWRTLTTPNWSFLRVKVSGAAGRDFDVYVYPHGGNKLWSKATHSGRTEILLDALAPGRWDVAVTAYRRTGRARVELSVF
jgi:hypothetical protein